MVVELSKTEPQTPDSLIGRKLDGRYEVLARIGEGGVGVVYKGKQTQLGRFVAIKVLHQDAARILEWRQRFEREARALSALAHPNVVPVTDFGIDNGVPFLVMELLQGKSLSDLIKDGPLPLWRALDIIRQLLRGLAFAHGKGIVHRDLKPANVFLQALPDQADHVRLLDFGMAKFMDGSTSSRNANETLTRAGIVFGTPAYMSTEQAKGGSVDARTDVYAAGILLFEILAGKRPFTDPTYEGIIMEHLTKPVPPLAKTRPELAAVAPLFQPLIERAMAKKPSARFKDAAAMLNALETVEEKLPAAATTGARRRPTPRPLRVTAARPRSRFWPRAILVIMGAAFVGAAGTYFVRDRAAPVETAARPGKSRAKTASQSPSPSSPAPSSPAPKSELAADAPRASSSPAAPPKPEAPPSPPPAPNTRAEDEGKPEPAAPAKQEKPAKPVKQALDERQARPRARNPWQAPVPRALRPLRDRIDRGAHMSQKALHPLYDFAHANPADARPWLLLGHAYAQLDWFSDSVDRYVKAYAVDSSCRGDPQMLADLLKAAAHPNANRSAARAVRDIYGPDAIPALNKAIERRAGEREAAARLVRLRDLLQGI